MGMVYEEDVVAIGAMSSRLAALELQAAELSYRTTDGFSQRHLNILRDKIEDARAWADHAIAEIAREAMT